MDLYHEIICSTLVVQVAVHPLPQQAGLLVVLVMVRQVVVAVAVAVKLLLPAEYQKAAMVVRVLLLL
jgi:hypothetical protein